MSNLFNLIFSCFASLIISILAIQSTNKLAHKIGFVDIPNLRKTHIGEIPLVGGIAIFLGFIFSILIAPISLSQYRAFIGVAGILIITGILDDFKETSPKIRLLIQILVASIIAIFDIKLNNLGSILGIKLINLSYLSVPITIIGIVGMINAINMLDGIDGLAGGISLVSLASMAIIAYKYNLCQACYMLSTIVSAILGFLIFNLPIQINKINKTTEKIFMGDSGSMFLGFVIAYFSIYLTQKNPETTATLIAPSTMLWFNLVPIFNIAGVVARRIKNKTKIYKADREHIHHLLEDSSYSKNKISLLLVIISIIAVIIGYIFTIYKVGDNTSVITFTIALIIYVAWQLKWNTAKLTGV